MDYRDQDSNSEGLFGARNENSVLFSLDSLNALDSDASNNNGSGYGNSGEESGLIDINTLTKMSNSGSDSDDGESAPIAMESMVFNQVVTKHEKRKTALIIIGFVVFALVAVTAGYFIIKDIQEKNAKEMHEQEIAAEQSKKEAEELQKKIDELEQQKQQAESEGKRRQADQEEIEKQLAKLRAQQAELATPDTGDSGDSSKKGNKKNTSKPGAPSEPSAPAAPPAPKKASVEAVKSALGAVSTKAQKCGKGGSLSVSFNISGNKAKGVQATGGSFKGTATEKCILTVINNHSWPDGTASGIKYTFKL